MPKITKVKTGSKFEDIASYSRVVAVDNLIMVSNTATCPPLGSTTYKVEIEVTAYRGAAKGDVELINIA